MAIVIDTRRVAGKIYIVDHKRLGSTVIRLICGDDPDQAVVEHPQSRVEELLPLRLHGRCPKLRLDVTAMPRGSQTFLMPRFVDRASRLLESAQPTVELTQELALEWGWYGAEDEPPAPPLSMPAGA